VLQPRADLWIGILPSGFAKRGKLKPTNAGVQNDVGRTLETEGRFAESAAAYRAAIALQPDFREAHCNLARLLSRTGDRDEANECLQEALSRWPEDVELVTLLGRVLAEQGNTEEAVTILAAVAGLLPQAETFNNLAFAHNMAGNTDKAVTALRRAVALKPDHALAWSNLGNALKDCGDLEEAINCYNQALLHAPGDHTAASNRIFALHFHPAYDAAALYQENLAWSERFAEPLREHWRPHCNSADPTRRLRVGYVSPDFREHVVGWNLLPLLREHDHSAVEVFCYSDVRNPDDMTEKLRACADVWRNTGNLTDAGLSDLIRNDAIDVLVDLSLHTSGNRLLVFARKPAPVQVSYLGYCSTTGLQAIDYRFSDPHLDPPGTDLSCYSEETVRLPASYWCYEPGGPTPDIAPPPAFANGYVTFGCLNNFGKVSAPALDTWRAILSATPGSRLLLHAPEGRARAKVLADFTTTGVSADRIQCVSRQKWPTYVAHYQQIDIALDPFPFAGGITTCDALWMGIPVVSLSGVTAVGRGGRSIISNIGRPELLATDVASYVSTACTLAADLPRLAELRTNLRQRMEESPLRHAPALARNIESAYRSTWRAWCSK